MSKSKTPKTGKDTTSRKPAVYKDLAQRYARQLEVIQEINQIMGANEQTETALLSALHHLLHSLDYQAAQIYRLSPTGSPKEKNTTV